MFIKLMKPLNNSKGQNLVEAAILIPILLLIVFGIIEFGRIFSAYAVVNNTARDWARKAAIYNYDETQVEADALNDLITNYGITSAIVDAIPFVDTEGDDAIEVEITYDVPLIAPIISAIIDDDSDGSFTITAVCSMRYE